MASVCTWACTEEATHFEDKEGPETRGRYVQKGTELIEFPAPGQDSTIPEK